MSLLDRIRGWLTPSPEPGRPSPGTPMERGSEREDVPVSRHEPGETDADPTLDEDVPPPAR